MLVSDSLINTYCAPSLCQAFYFRHLEYNCEHRTKLPVAVELVWKGTSMKRQAISAMIGDEEVPFFSRYGWSGTLEEGMFEQALGEIIEGASPVNI